MRPKAHKADSPGQKCTYFEICKTYNDSIEHGLHAGTDHLVRNCEEFMKLGKSMIDMCQNMLQALERSIHLQLLLALTNTTQCDLLKRK